MNKPIVSKQSFSFIDELYDYLFKLNVCNESVLCLNQKKIQLPKCRSPQSRSLCFELIIELCRSINKALISFVSEQHSNYIHNQHHNFNIDTSKNMPEKVMDTEKVSIDENNSKKNTHKLNMSLFYKSILDKTNH